MTTGTKPGWQQRWRQQLRAREIQQACLGSLGSCLGLTSCKQQALGYEQSSS